MTDSPKSIQERFRHHKAGVLIPTYNNERTLRQVLESVLQYTENVIVVNDGSTDSTIEILQSFPQIDVVSYPKNIGKGWALRQGFKRALERGFDYLITIDSDGQHFADDLPRFLEKLEEAPGSLSIGARNMDQSSVPGKSSFGNKFSNFWYWVETGLKMPDTQSGYRLYPIRKMEKMKFLTKKFEFEIEVIVRSSWRGIPINAVPVKVFYAEKENRVSHFRPFKDFSRISVLNTVLVTIALLYIKPRDLFLGIKKKNFRQILRDLIFNPYESDYLKAVSVGFGVFMGIIPLWGFQMLIAITISIFFRLNKALVLIAANISFPPFIPVILYLSLLMGKIWMGKEAIDLSFDKDINLDTVHQSFVQYFYGAVTLALLSGLLFGLVTFILLKFSKHERLKKESVNR